jgi:hypothetical protein
MAPSQIPRPLVERLRPWIASVTNIGQTIVLCFIDKETGSGMTVTKMTPISSEKSYKWERPVLLW